MKRVLSLLLAFVLIQTQTWALSGGPFGNVQGQSSLTGSYAGVLIPDILPVGNAATAIGLFTLVQPDAGLATGNVTVFVNGAAFAGTINGVMDPKTGSFRGLIDAQSTFQVQLPVTTTQIVGGVPVAITTLQPFNVFAQGSVDAEVSLDNEVNLFTTSASSPTRIEGTAIIDVFFDIDVDGTPIITRSTTFSVDGFKQSDT
jgi:hypothetical protein